MWIDYIKMLERCGRDIQSPKYICPANLQEEHDRYVRKLQTIQEKEKKADDIRKAQEREASFKEQKKSSSASVSMTERLRSRYWKALRNTGRRLKVSIFVCSVLPTISVRTALSSQRG